MTAEQIPRRDQGGDNVRELRAVKWRKELSSRAVPPVVPPVLEWGPTHNRPDYVEPELETPEDLTYNV